MLHIFTNPIRTAVDRIGGPTKAAHAAKVCNATVHEWISKKRIPNIEKAKLIASLSGMELQQLRSTW